MVLNTLDLGQSQRLRLNTLVRLRWLAIVGQSVTVVIVAYGLGFPLPVVPCFAMIACSAGLNIYLALQYPSTHRLPPTAAFGILTFDAMQLAGLLYMTGGLTNPFSLLMAVPVVVSATSLPLRMTALLGGMVVAMATLLAFFHLPLPWYDGAELAMPFIYVAGAWVALSSLHRLHRHLRLPRRRGSQAARQRAVGDRTRAAARAASLRARRPGRRRRA